MLAFLLTVMFPSKTVSETHYVTTESQAKVVPRAGEVNSGGAGAATRAWCPPAWESLSGVLWGF